MDSHSSLRNSTLVGIPRTSEHKQILTNTLKEEFCVSKVKHPIVSNLYCFKAPQSAQVMSSKCYNLLLLCWFESIKDHS